MAEIVVGVDGSPPSRQALEWAALEAENRHRDLLVVKNWHDPMFGGPGFSAMYEADLVRLDAEAELEAIARAAREAHPAVRIESALVDGSPVSSLLMRARDAELLVVGSRGNGGFLKLELGSVSTKAARRSLVPIVIVRGEHDRSHCSDVVVGVDGSACSRHALRWAADWAKAHDKSLVVLMAWNHLEPQGAHGPMRFDPNYDAGAASGALSAMAADVLGGLDNPRIQVEAVCDLPARAVLKRAADACLIVVGRHGVSRWAPPELGATAIQVLHHAECPVAVVPEPHDDHEPVGP
jgi:nucleotide-binding universal stress UspA family protein